MSTIINIQVTQLSWNPSFPNYNKLVDIGVNVLRSIVSYKEVCRKYFIIDPDNTIALMMIN